MDEEVTQEEIGRLSAVAGRVLAEDGEAWLFGSQARGTSRPDSDWDVLVLLGKESLSHTGFVTYAYPFIEEGWDIDAMVSPILLTKNDWEASSFTPFYKNVVNDRIAL